ncbi:hypothetical protein PanWU01x14_254750 [Parasponia andersonii]|uniref:Uncharacterized protein n=1 Tax=Parasponia andersonii TaxID=3476 RepID=A0A2P5BB07_PARAD|nr:hypothetical protein PanWU01x14_254750 [Parasponia andersonii]
MRPLNTKKIQFLIPVTVSTLTSHFPSKTLYQLLTLTLNGTKLSHPETHGFRLLPHNPILNLPNSFPYPIVLLLQPSQALLQPLTPISPSSSSSSSFTRIRQRLVVLSLRLHHLIHNLLRPLLQPLLISLQHPQFLIKPVHDSVLQLLLLPLHRLPRRLNLLQSPIPFPHFLHTSQQKRHRFQQSPRAIRVLVTLRIRLLFLLLLNQSLRHRRNRNRGGAKPPNGSEAECETKQSQNYLLCDAFEQSSFRLRRMRYRGSNRYRFYYSLGARGAPVSVCRAKCGKFIPNWGEFRLKLGRFRSQSLNSDAAGSRKWRERWVRIRR